MNSEQYAALQEELASFGKLSEREKMIFDLGWQKGRSYELKRKIGRAA